MAGLGNDTSNAGRCAVARLTPDGAFDPSFGIGGVALTDLGVGFSQSYPDGASETALDVALDSRERIIAGTGPKTESRSKMTWDGRPGGHE